MLPGNHVLIGAVSVSLPSFLVDSLFGLCYTGCSSRSVLTSTVRSIVCEGLQEPVCCILNERWVLPVTTFI